MSGLKSANRRKMRVAVAHVGKAAFDLRMRDCFAASVSRIACSAGSEFSITSRRAAPKVTMRSQISAPIEPPPPVTMIDLPFTKRSSRR